MTRQKGGNMHRQYEHGASMSISYITHAFVHEQSSRGYTFEACVIGGVRVRCGVGEVDVLGTFVVEVVILACSRVGGRGSRDLGDGSGHVYRCLSFRRFSCHRCRGTCGLRTFRSRSCDGSRSRSFGEVLDDSNVFGATVVVHGPRDVDRSGSDLRVLRT